ncbi:MAG: SCO family protein [Phycisphaerae bacterium]
MLLSLAVVGGVAYLQYRRVDDARTPRSPAAPVTGLPVLNALPDFSLTERSGRTIRLSDLKGTVWVADFIFTTCGGPCPIMTNRMRDLQETFRRLKLRGVRTVSFTVDPETDTPEILREYATLKQADPFDWYFLTGSEREIHDLSIKGFLLTAAEGDGSHAVEHSPRFALVDRQGRLRATYEVVSDEEVFGLPRAEVIDKPMSEQTKRKLIADIRSLLNEHNR